ncbi:MAG TPA: AMP-binding protein, partial [Candidatus Binatia bacterium]|nr:AMP-binding protein [Candidatus Binatia bacterium]
MFFDRAAALGDRPRYRHHRDGEWRDVSWTTMATRVRQIAAALIDMGVTPGDRIALLSGTRAEWMEVDFAILSTGALTIPIYPSVLAAECGYILNNAGATMAFVENAAQRAKVVSARDDGVALDGVVQRSPIRAIVTIDDDAS